MSTRRSWSTMILGAPNGLAIWPTTPPRGKEAARGGSHGDWVTQPAMDGFDGLFMWIRQ